VLAGISAILYQNLYIFESVLEMCTIFVLLFFTPVLGFPQIGPPRTASNQPTLFNQFQGNLQGHAGHKSGRLLGLNFGGGGGSGRGILGGGGGADGSSDTIDMVVNKVQKASEGFKNITEWVNQINNFRKIISPGGLGSGSGSGGGGGQEGGVGGSFGGISSQSNAHSSSSFQ